MPRIPDLNDGTQATTVNAADLVIIEQGGVTKPAPASLILGGGSVLTDTAPATQYVHASGSDTGAGTVDDPLATLAEARRRIGDRHGDCVIYIDGPPGTEFETVALGRARVGRGRIHIVGGATDSQLTRNVTDVTGRVLTVDGADLDVNAWRGWLADLGPSAGNIAIQSNTADTITLTKVPDVAPTTVSVYRPGIELKESTSRYPICGGPNPNWQFDYLTLENVELVQATALLTGNLEFVGVTAAPGISVEIDRAWIHSGPNCGLSMRGEFGGSNPGTLRLSETSGALLGHLGTFSARLCGFAANSEQINLAGSAASVTAYASRIDLDAFDLFDALNLRGSVSTLGASFTPVGSPTYGGSECSTVYCSTDLSAFLGEDVSAPATYFDAGNTITRV